MNKKIIASIGSFVAGTIMLTVVAVSTASAQQSTTVAAAQLPKIITRSDQEISARVTSLNNLSTRIQAAKNVSATEKTTISNEIQTNLNGLSALKTKIDADTDATVALADEKSIFGSYRIYALVIPQGYIAASADRVSTIGAMLNAISVKLQKRITAAQNGGKDVTPLQTALTDLYNKVNDANTQAGTALAGIASLTPDQGNQTQLQLNTTALKAARANIKTATGDLQTARQDAKTIIGDLKAFNLSAGASASPTVSQ